jgi:signal transduction histidine kinase
VGALPAAFVDATRIAQVLRNLLTNAMRHTPEGGTITVSASADDGHVTVSVRDDGPGIPAEHLPHVFERFYRADPSRARTTGGAGLGLAIVQGIVHAHGGTVAAASEGGAVFRFTLPLAR